MCPEGLLLQRITNSLLLGSQVINSAQYALVLGDYVFLGNCPLCGINALFTITKHRKQHPSVSSLLGVISSTFPRRPDSSTHWWSEIQLHTKMCLCAFVWTSQFCQPDRDPGLFAFIYTFKIVQEGQQGLSLGRMIASCLMYNADPLVQPVDSDHLF